MIQRENKNHCLPFALFIIIVFFYLDTFVDSFSTSFGVIATISKSDYQHFVTTSRPNNNKIRSSSTKLQLQSVQQSQQEQQQQQSSIQTMGEGEEKLEQDWVKKHTYVHNTKLNELYAPDPPDDVVPIYDNNNNNNNELIKTITKMNYCHPSTKIAQLGRDVDGKDSDVTGPDQLLWESVPVWIYSGRQDPNINFHQNGFQLLHDDEIITKNINFLNKDDVIDIYYPHCEKVLSDYLSQQDGIRVQVFAFDHNIRMQESPKDVDETTTAVVKTVVQKPIGGVHGDYTTISGPRRLQQLGEEPKLNDILRERLIANNQGSLIDPAIVSECIGETNNPNDDTEEVGSGTSKNKKHRRYAFVNLWRSIDKDDAIESYPLACMDATTNSLSGTDLRTLQIFYKDRIGENFLTCYDPDHKWYYYPAMQYNEVLLIKQWDSYGTFATNSAASSNSENNSEESKEDKFISTFSIHSAFQDALTKHHPNPRPRQSIEVRCVAIWDSYE